MLRKLNPGEKALATHIDSGVKNKWNFKWLEEKLNTTVFIGLKDKKIERNVELCVGDSIWKAHSAGVAICEWCGDNLKYEGKGKAALLKHMTSDKHMGHVKTRLTNNTMGSFGTSVSKELQQFSDNVMLSGCVCVCSSLLCNTVGLLWC